jgi:hypothetical protein
VESPEEREMPDPVQFEFAHSVLGKPRVEAVQEYRDLWAEHVHPSLCSGASRRKV